MIHDARQPDDPGPASAPGLVGLDDPQTREFAARPQGPMPEAGMTGRGAIMAMFAVFFVGTAAADWLHLGVLVGLGLVSGCVLAVRYAKPSALLAVVITPPMIFLAAVICAEILTSSSANGHSGLLSAAAGTVLTLAAAAPWLFGGQALALLVALFRGLPQSVRELRAGLRGDDVPAAARR
jgi:hypothetical protein